MPHRPVLVEEVIAGLNLKKGGIYLDGTVGAGGHAEAILKELGANGRFIGIDCDAEILAFSRRRLAPFDLQTTLVLGHYEEIPTLLAGLGLSQVDGILLDLGVSSWQLDQAARGFSFSREGPLDMRMDLAMGKTAADLVARLSAGELAEIFRNWGEERYADRIARAVVQTRRTHPLRTTRELADLVRSVVPRRTGPLHPATRVFQGLRIAVNRELERLDRFLTVFPHCLRPGGRTAIISYHSLEDRKVKWAFRNLAKATKLDILTPKPIRPSAPEVEGNPRARSARLRIVERQGGWDS